MFMYCLCEQIKELKYVKQGTICINNLLVEWDDFPIQFSLSLWAVSHISYNHCHGGALAIYGKKTCQVAGSGESNQAFWDYVSAGMLDMCLLHQ